MPLRRPALHPDGLAWLLRLWDPVTSPCTWLQSLHDACCGLDDAWCRLLLQLHAAT